MKTLLMMHQTMENREKHFNFKLMTFPLMKALTMQVLVSTSLQQKNSVNPRSLPLT